MDAVLRRMNLPCEDPDLIAEIRRNDEERNKLSLSEMKKDLVSMKERKCKGKAHETCLTCKEFKKCEKLSCNGMKCKICETCARCELSDKCILSSRCIVCRRHWECIKCNICKICMKILKFKIDECEKNSWDFWQKSETEIDIKKPAFTNTAEYIRHVLELREAQKQATVKPSTTAVTDIIVRPNLFLAIEKEVDIETKQFLEWTWLSDWVNYFDEYYNPRVTSESIPPTPYDKEKWKKFQNEHDYCSSCSFLNEDLLFLEYRRRCKMCVTTFCYEQSYLRSDAKRTDRDLALLQCDPKIFVRRIHRLDNKRIFYIRIRYNDEPQIETCTTCINFVRCKYCKKYTQCSDCPTCLSCRLYIDIRVEREKNTPVFWGDNDWDTFDEDYGIDD